MNCYMKLENGILRFGNDCLERAISCGGSVPQSLYLKDIQTGHCLQGESVPLFCLSEERYVCTAHSRPFGADGLRVILSCMGERTLVEATFLLFDGIPFFSSHLYVSAAEGARAEECLEESGMVEAFSLPKTRMKLTVTTLRSPGEDCPIDEREEQVGFDRRLFCTGNVFRFSDGSDGVTVVAESPCGDGDSERRGLLILPDGTVHVCGSGREACVADRDGDECYGVAIGVCAGERALTEYRRFYRKQQRLTPYALLAGSDEPDLLERAADLGVDGVFLSNPVRSGAVCRLAVERGMAVGIGFSPDPTDSYRNFRRDAETMIRLYRRFGIRYFQIERICVADKAADRNLRRLAEEVVRETEGGAVLQFDGACAWYLYRKQFGTLQIRESDPHRALRVLWQLSRYVPLQRFSVRIAATEAPDYCFGICAAANPLIGATESIGRLRELIAVWRKWRNLLAQCVISPIGQQPCGRAWTGFYAESDRERFLLIFREQTEEAECCVPVFGTAEVLFGAVTAAETETGITVRSERPMTFGWIRLSGKERREE